MFSVLDEAPESAHIWISENNQYSWYLTWTDLLGVGFELFLLSGNCRGKFSFHNHMLWACFSFHMYNLSVYYRLASEVAVKVMFSVVTVILFLGKGSLYRNCPTLYRRALSSSCTGPKPNSHFVHLSPTPLCTGPPDLFKLVQGPSPPLLALPPPDSHLFTMKWTDCRKNGRLVFNWNGFLLSMHSYSVHFLHVSFFYVLNGMDIVCSNNKHLTQMRSVNSHTRDRMSVDVCVSVCLYIPAAVDCVYLGVSFCGIVLWSRNTW